MIPETLAHLAIPIDSIKPHPRNVRQGDVGAISESLKLHGQYRPIVVQKSTGHILAGNHTYKAARALKWKQIAATYVDVTDDQAVRILLMDNRANDLASYDDPALADILKQLMETDQRLEGTGFDPDDLEQLLRDIDAEELPTVMGDPDDVPEDVPAKTVPGDIWLLGRHRLRCGDSTSPSDLDALMNGVKAQLCHADPPYGMGKEKDGVLNDNLYADKLDQFQLAWWAACRPHLEDNASAYIWGNPEDLWRLWWKAGFPETEPLTFRNEIVWSKPVGFGQRSSEMRSFSSNTERALFFVLGEHGFNKNAENYWHGWEPVRAWLDNERIKSGLTGDQCNKICGKTNMTQSAFTKGGFRLILQEDYEKLREASKGKAFQRDYADLKKEYDALKEQFNSSRAYFDNSHDNMNEVWEFNKVSGEERHGHATPKPVAMIERAIKSSCPENGVVLEPFGGSGSTLIAAEQTNRTAYLMELDPHYCDVICARFQKATGIKPIAEATGNEHNFL